MLIHAVYEHGVFRPIEPVQLPESCPVRLVVSQEAPTVVSDPASAPLSKLAAIAASHADNPKLPADLAQQHDHYLYGAPKSS